MQAAILRKPWADDMPDQSFTLAEAMAGYTVEGALRRVCRAPQGATEARLSWPIWSCCLAIETVDRHKLNEVHPVTTICGGRITYQA